MVQVKPREFEEALSSRAYVLESLAPDGTPAILVGEEITSKEILWPPALFSSRPCLFVLACDCFINTKLIHLPCINKNTQKSNSKKIKITHNPIHKALSLQSIIICQVLFLYVII